jgi:hypothetical protein
MDGTSCQGSGKLPVTITDAQRAAAFPPEESVGAAAASATERRNSRRFKPE